MYDEIILDKAVKIASKNGWDGNIESSGYAPLIFNKDFCKALFGKNWEHHLKEMVVSPDVIKYISDHMEDANA